MAAWKCSSCRARHSFSLVTCREEGTSPGDFTFPPEATGSRAGLRGRGQGRPRLASPGGRQARVGGARAYPVGAEGRDDVLVGGRLAVGAARPVAGVAELPQEPAQGPQRGAQRRHLPPPPRRGGQ